MREESAIFRDLSTVCTSPGYVHALAYLCFRDTVVRYSDQMCAKDVEHLFLDRRLIRTETLTLLGLVVQKDIDWCLPDAATLQRYVDETELLLKELHEAMSAPALEQLRDSFGLGKQLADPFQFGPNLREPIFYSGESAYSFQFRELSVAKYQADDLWLAEHKGFSIQSARDVVQALVKLQSAKFTFAIDSPEDCIPHGWALSSCFTFTTRELADFSGMDQHLIQAVVNSFVLPAGERNSSFCAIDDFNAVSAMPILLLGEGRFLLLEQYSLEQSLNESPFFWMCRDQSYSDTALRNRGKFVESVAAERLRCVFGKKKVISNVTISGTKGKDAGEIDVLVSFANRAIIVQAKSKRLTLEARKGNDNRIRDDFKKSVQSSYDQAFECAQLLVRADNALVGPDGANVKIPKHLTEIYIFCLVSDHYPALSLQARQFLQYFQHSSIQPPFVLDIFTLDTMVEMLDTPLLFLDYIKRRATYHEKIHANHELTILSFHLKRNLWFDDRYGSIQLLDDFSADLDIAMMVRREGVPGPRTPDGILTRLKGTRVGEIVKAIESRPDPGTISLGFALLMLAEETVVNLSNSIDKMARQTSMDGCHHDLTLPMGETGEGLIVHCNTDPVWIAHSRLEKHCLLRKYKAKAARWFGICIAPDASLRFGINIEFDWEPNRAMDHIVSAHPRNELLIDMAAPEGRTHKIGRNDPCPCRSGRKYKRCCLL